MKPPVEKVIDLTKLSQGQVAFCIGKPAHWVRSHGHMFVRDAAGRYDIRQVIKALVEAEKPARQVAAEFLAYGPLI